MSSNSQIIQKADMVVGDLASGGVLNEEQTNAFIRKLIVQPTILRLARLVTMRAQKRQINKIGFGSRILRPGVEGAGLAVGDRSKPTTEQVLLDTKEVIAEVRLTYDVIEDNIERGNLGIGGATGPNSGRPVSGGIKDTIVTLMAEQAATDLEELALLGDTASGDTYLAILDGYIKQATSNVFDNASAGVSKALWKEGIKTMPDQYLRNRAAMWHMVSVDNETEYRDTLASRETSGGDAIISGNNQVFGFGIPVLPVSLMPAATGLLSNPLNLIFGIQRDISIEVDKDVSARQFIIVLTAKVDFKIEEEEAVVKYTNV